MAMRMSHFSSLQDIQSLRAKAEHDEECVDDAVVQLRKVYRVCEALRQLSSRVELKQPQLEPRTSSSRIMVASFRNSMGNRNIDAALFGIPLYLVIRLRELRLKQ